MKIGIEINGIVRDINKQYLKYYVKEINPAFDEEKVDMNVTSILPQLKFESEYIKQKFIFEDYPFEIFGCAHEMTRNLHAYLNGWSYGLYWNDNVEDISLFSLGEDELSIQSTHFFLSKGSRLRNLFFPRHVSDVWDLFDVVITQDNDIVSKKPENGIAIVIAKHDNASAQEGADFVYNSLEDIMNDERLLYNLYEKFNNKNNISFIKRFGRKIKGFIKKCYNGIRTNKRKDVLLRH